MTESAAAPRILIVIPVYNHRDTLRSVVQGALLEHPHVLVVDDGSTDMPAPGSTVQGIIPADFFSSKYSLPEHPLPEYPLKDLPVHYIRHDRNKGKGAAILTAADYARQLGMTHIITLDADAQHNPAELPAFMRAIVQAPLTIFVGKRDFNTPNVPGSSRFGRSFSNFWFKVQTSRELGDTQCGFRAYPLAVLDHIRCTESRYSFEVEVLVRAAWAGFEVDDVPISVYYPPREERVSHFRPLFDNVLISLLNTRLTIRAVMPVPQKQFAHDAAGRITPLHPLRSLRALLVRDETPKNLALAAGLGVAIGTLPLIGLHSILIILAAGALRLNKLAGLGASQLCMPPFVPAVCIEVGHYIRHGSLLTEVSLRTLGYEALDRLAEWIIGSLLLAPALCLLAGLIVFALAQSVKRGLTNLSGGIVAADSAVVGSAELTTARDAEHG